MTVISGNSSRSTCETLSPEPAAGPVDCSATASLHPESSFSHQSAKCSGDFSRHGERSKITIAERQKFSALLKMLRVGLT
jgi:hypothetical protein